MSSHTVQEIIRISGVDEMFSLREGLNLEMSISDKKFNIRRMTGRNKGGIVR